MRPYFPCREPGRPIFVAHRGASDRALENSPAAFALAVSDGADMIEFDVRLSSDGVPVVFHDVRTGRTAKENLAVARTPAARLRAVRLKNGERLPFLADVLEIVGGSFRSTSNRKRPAGSPPRRRRSRRRATEGNFSCRRGCATSASPRGTSSGDTLRAGHPPPVGVRPAFRLRHGVSSIHPAAGSSPSCVSGRSAASGIPFLPYTVDAPTESFALIAAGAAGVFSNRAQTLREEWYRR